MAGKDELNEALATTLHAMQKINEALLERLEALAPKPIEQDADKRASELYDSLHPKTPLGVVVVHEGATSIFSGATLDLELQRGISCRFHNYKEPEAAMRHVKDGGLCPDGLKIWEESTGSKLSPAYKQWRYETFMQADNRAIIGRPFSTAFVKLAEAPAKTGT
jgi:hypothetical protein